jgi:hypothetical protein|mmetsp:Transcript_8374/g.12212  ORF Transcript_8374/g.12212 Transcript_8374/m.12212 type:complete len:201 (+) Transcript_8374:2290-2892(+)
MSDLHLLSLIILRLEEARFTREAEVRLIAQHIQRFEELRDQRALQVRQRLLRTNTYNETRTQADLNDNAPIFFPQDDSDSLSETSNNETIPELERAEIHEPAAEQAFIEERGYLDVEQAERDYIRRRINSRTRRHTRLSLNRARDLREPRHRPRDFNNRERDARLARLTATADAIVLDLLRDIVNNLTTTRRRVNRTRDD